MAMAELQALRKLGIPLTTSDKATSSVEGATSASRYFKVLLSLRLEYSVSFFCHSQLSFCFFQLVLSLLRATSHKRLRAPDHFTSSTLIGGKGGAGPSSLHTTLEGPTDYVDARWMESLHGFLHGIKWIMFHDHWTIFKNHLLEVGLTQNRETMALRMLTTVVLFYWLCL
jgi:hypothetical protein